MSKKSGLTKRQKLIIEMLAAFNADDPITIQAISEKLKLSSRTVLREMPRINEWFEENDFKLVKKPRIGMYVDEDAETRNYIKELVDMDENKPVYSKTDRQMIILLELLTINEPLKYFYFTSLFHISDATLSNDLEEVETWLDHYNLTLYRRPGMGIYWEGKEEDYRQAVTMVLRQKLRGRSLKVLFDEEKRLKERMFPNLTQKVLDDTRDIIKNMQEVLDIEYTDHSFRHLSLYLLITQNRVRMGHEIKEEKDITSITHLPEYQIAKWLGSKLSSFEGHQLSQGEVYNIAMQLLAAKIWKNKSENKIDEESFKVRQLVMQIIAEMEILLEMEFFENAVLIDGLCNHMKPAINRMKQGVFTENQYIDFLEEKYSKVYAATIKACEFLKEELHIKKLPEGEMGFIALYFCVAVEQQKDKEEKLSVYVACPHGVGTSHMLAVHLKKEFPQLMVQKIISTAEIKEEELIEEGIDFIVSTAKLNLTVPNVYVNSILTETDKKMINAMIKNIDKKKRKSPVKTVKPVKRIGREDIEYMTLLGEEILQVLDNIKISTGENIKNKKQLIEYAGELFARNETMAAEITFALNKRENIASTFIPSMNALFLHCETKGIRHCRFGFVYLNDEIIEDGQPIKGAILMLVPQGDGSKVYREVMSEISGALAEKDQIITYLFDKNRNAVEAELETSLGNYYENKMKRR